MRNLLLYVLALSFFTATGNRVAAQNADDIIQKHIAAIGGTEKWNGITSLKMVGSMNFGGVELGMTETLVSDKALRMDISAMGMAGFTIITPTEGWMYMPFQPGMDKVMPMPKEQVEASKNKLNMKGAYLTDRSKITTAEYVGRDTVNSAACYKLKITDVDGNSQVAYFDAATYYLVRSEMKVKVQDQEQEIAASFTNFQKLPEGIVVPMTISADQGDVNFKTIEINKPIDESVFKPIVPKTDSTGKQ